MPRYEKQGKQGDLVMWCQDCETFVSYPDGKFDNGCRKCGETMVRRKCYRCGHEWVPNARGSVPARCPRCKTPYWNRARVVAAKRRDDEDGWDL